MRDLQFPLIKITLFFVLGIVFSHLFHPSVFVVISLLFFGLITSVLLYFTTRNSLNSKPYFGVSALFTSFIIGSFSLQCNNEMRNKEHYIHHLKSGEENYSVHLIVLEKLKNTTKNDRYTSEIYQLNGEKSVGKIILNIRKDALTPTIDIGSHIQVSGSLYRNRNPNNPNQFDYGRYLENKEIYAQIYADANAIKISTVYDRNLNFYASKIRNKIIHNLEKNGFRKSELSVVNALILGQQQDISQEIIHDYQYAGAIHVLSVSGLHVGFILLFITTLLKPFANTRKNNILKLIITIVSLWLFGILAGLAPCVIRSVTMFTFVAIGLFLRRTVNIYNTLMVSILIILLFEPSFLFDIGFQLSYLALFFIVWFHPLLSSIWTPKNKNVKKYFWDVITVSFAAQIGTMPLCIYYFHQFSGLFFITNLVILPAVSIILGLGVVVMILAAFDFVWHPMMKLLEILIYVLNKIINWIASFERFVIKDIPINLYMMISLFLIIIIWILWFKKPSFSKIVLGFTSIILFQIIVLNANYTNEKANEMIVFTKNKTSIITERKGKRISVYSNDSILKNIDDNLAIKSYMIANFCKINKKKSISNLYYFKGKKILVIDSAAVYLQDKKPDVLILINSPKISLERVFKSWKPEIVVADASNYKSYIKIWKGTCEKEKIPFHATAEKGFYKL